ncbi:hypothetical protein POM88_024549 [Heracleum sosnowskyi]|uniref:Uncharacterized protein n=1 Tax=Heracleum sosnowskyi TaxID=360622 RepID=A0AAD8MIZ7_9APIA|nr:hypothetical protein POM88_024549 [Heracleum sosnowskyi]
MGRSPCCSKVGLNRGVWTSAEDKILTDYIQLHGEGRWRNLPKRAGLMRCGKSCRLRWLNYLRPDIKRGNISDDEEDLIIRLHKLLGNRWSLIAGRLPGRTDNEIKNYWNTSLRKKGHGKHTTSGPFPSKIPTTQNNMKKKRQSTQDNVDSKLQAQTPSADCTKLLINSAKPDDHATNEPVPKIQSMFHSESGSENDKMYENLIPSGSRETVPVNNNEPLSEPNKISQLEPDIGSGDKCLTKLYSPGFSGLFGSDFYNYEENEIRSTPPSSSNEKSMMEVLEEFWNVENIIIEPSLDYALIHIQAIAYLNCSSALLFNWALNFFSPKTCTHCCSVSTDENWVSKNVSTHISPNNLNTSNILLNSHWKGDPCYTNSFLGPSKFLTRTLVEVVPPTELQNVLHSIPGIFAAAMSLYLIKEVGHILMAYVVRSPGSNLSELCSLVFLQCYTKALTTVQQASLVEKSRQKWQDRMKTLTNALKIIDYTDD